MIVLEILLQGLLFLILFLILGFGMSFSIWAMFYICSGECQRDAEEQVRIEREKKLRESGHGVVEILPFNPYEPPEGVPDDLVREVKAMAEKAFEQGHYILAREMRYPIYYGRVD